ncbi:FAD-dependent oxidoreductase [Candidimonas sp. SYP-B2681]|uniref:FAD-dependent oxidoreductase n=1 Tax=Candidimonas sp. SYP-B2681 TaxID=2497686 RepID=UPI0013151301|nr:FAD-dependent oxidoreductase [Candidimonas sp. SYP-B2681]
MHVVVVGAGIVGVCTALELIREGHKVTVVDAASNAASQASYANAGLLSPGHCFSWAEPGTVQGVLSAFILGKDRPRIGRPRNAALVGWLRLFAKQSSVGNWKRNSRHALQLARLSREIHFSTDDIPLSSYGGSRNGLLYLYKAGEAPAEAELDLLREAGEPFEVLRGNALRALDPSLNGANADSFHGGTYCPLDACGDARLYALEAARIAGERSAQFRWETRVGEILMQEGRVVGISTESGVLPCDACVVATGYASKELLRPLKYKLQIHPVSGYSLTYHGIQGARPVHGGVSISDKIAWAPFGEGRMRFTGFADIGHPDKTLSSHRFASLEAFARKLCPAVEGMEVEQWVGQRPMTPDGLPYLGAGTHQGLFLNCGHGAMGWTMASASARLTAQVMAGRTPSMDLTPFRHDRRFL